MDSVVLCRHNPEIHDEGRTHATHHLLQWMQQQQQHVQNYTIPLHNYVHVGNVNRRLNYITRRLDEVDYLAPIQLRPRNSIGIPSFIVESSFQYI